MANQLSKEGRNGLSHSTSMRIASDPAEARQVQDRIESALQELGYSEHDIFSIRLAVEEALLNAIKHGNRMDRRKQVEISYRICADRFEVSIADQGEGFDPADVPDPTLEENVGRVSGRGLMLMRHFMTEVRYTGCGNAVSMCKLRNGKA